MAMALRWRSRMVVLRGVGIYRDLMPLFWQYVIGALVVCGLIAAAVGRECGRGVLDSFLYGFVLGPFGVLLIPLLAIANKPSERITGACEPSPSPSKQSPRPTAG